MILFVFEGAEREPKIFKTLERLFFGAGERIVCSFGNNIYELYRQLTELDGDGDIVSVLRENNAQLPAGIKSSDFSEIYLFFDYDFQNTNLTLDQMNERLQEMLEMFDDETDNGKLYVSYPIVESLCYTKQLPDEHFVEYTISRKDCTTWSVGLGAIDFILRLSSDTYESLYYQMPEKQRMLFLAIAKEGKATTVTGGQFIKKHKLNSASSVSSALKGLLDKDFITFDKNAYSVYDQFFSLWLTFKGMI